MKDWASVNFSVIMLGGTALKILQNKGSMAYSLASCNQKKSIITNKSKRQLHLLCAGQGAGGLTVLSVELLQMIQTQELLLGLVAGAVSCSSSRTFKSQN